MRAVLSLFGQFVLACFGYVAAVAAVGLFAAAAMGGTVGEGAVVSAEFGDPHATIPTAVGIGIAAMLAAGSVGFLPALVAILFAETFGVRSVFFYLLAAILVAVLLAAPADVLGAPAPAEAAPVPFLIACGTVAGAVYWLVAGHRAGRWREALAGGAEA